MTLVLPWGSSSTASILVIGHDPRLQKSRAEAKYPFFFEYLEGPRPRSGPAQDKYDLAQAVVEYVGWLAGRPIAKDELYVTNLCNRYLDHEDSSGTVLIPEGEARLGISAISKTLSEGHFKLILPFSAQVFYYLCKLEFIDEKTDSIQAFVQGARPRERKAENGLYVGSVAGAFLQVCGVMFHDRGVPVVPVVHVRGWRNQQISNPRYRGPMENAKREVRAALEVA